MTKVPITLACGDYDIMRALKEGQVQPDGIDLTVLTAMDSSPRHWRFFRNRDYDMAEVSSSAYFAAREHGMPFRAIPVFPHRRFRHGFVFTNTAAGIKKPSDLIGKRVGSKAFIFSATLWLRGILEHEYGVPHKSMEWFTELDEDVDFTPPPDLRIQRIPHEKSTETMLAEGELDALIHPDLIKPLLSGDPRVGRLWPDYKSEEIAYYRKTGIFPIMHLVAMRAELVEKYPWIPINMYHAFQESKAIAMKRLENPRIVPLAFYREAWEEQQELMGPDPWEYGLTDQNIKTLETLVQYSHEQGFISRRIPLDELFLNVTQGRKREEYRI
jgi:4,5-dihydroxyphthalate decarboxylase